MLRSALRLFCFAPLLVAMTGLAQSPKDKKDLTPEQKELLAEAEKWSNETAKLRKEGKLEEAIKAAEKMLAAEVKLYGELHDDPIGSLKQIAAMRGQQEKFDEAKKVLERILDLQTKRFGKEDWRVTDACLGIEYMQLIQKLSSAERKEIDRATALIRQVVELDEANPKEVLPLYQEALTIRKKVLGENHPDYVIILNNLACLLKAIGEYSKAEPLFLQSKEIAKKVLGENHPNYASSLNNLAEVYRDLGENAKAELLYLQSKEIRKKIFGENHPDYAESLNNLAELYRAMGENSKAEPLYLQAREIVKKVLGENHPNYATSLNNLAVLYRAIGENAKAEPLYLQSKEIRKKIFGENHPDYASTLHNLAVLYFEMGENTKAEPLYLQSKEIRKKIFGENHPDYAESLNSLAVLYREMGENAKAEPLFHQAKDIFKKVLGENHPDYATSLNNLAHLYFKMGENTKAEPLYLQAREIRKKVVGENHPDYADSLNHLAGLYKAMSQPTKAELFHLQAKEIRQKVLGENHPDYAQSLNNLAKLYIAMGQPAKAEPLYLQAVSIVSENLERSSEIQTEASQLTSAIANRPYWENLLHDNAKSNSSVVYEPLSRIRGAITSRQMFMRTARQAKPETKPLVEELQQVSRQMSQLVNNPPDTKLKIDVPKKMEELVQQHEKLQRDLASKSEAFAEYQKRKKATLTDLQAAIPEGAVFIDFLVYKDQLCAFVLNRKSIQRIELKELKPIEEAIVRFREQLTRTTPLTGKENDPALVLREKLWKPLLPTIGEAQLLLICPDGPLCRLPFAALPSADGTKYLIEEKAVAIIPVPQQLLDLAKPFVGSEKPSMLLVGGVQYDAEPGKPQADSQIVSRSGMRGTSKTEWSYLPGTAKEIDRIGTLFQKHQAGTLTQLKGEKATESAWESAAPKHTYLHLATHGFFSPKEVRSALQRPEGKDGKAHDLGMISFEKSTRPVGINPGLMSGVVLAGANRKDQLGSDDGIQTALELEELDLTKVRLTVLSACETGLGETAGGEGVLGLQRSLQLAGVRTTMTTLWQIPDDATQNLMTRFYGNLWEKKKPTLESLRESQVWMLNEGWKSDSIKNEVRGLKRTDIDDEAITKSGRLPPFFWAAFSLAGDWR